MKKIIIFLIILSVAFGTWISLRFALVPPNYILGYSVYEDEILFSICDYDNGVYLKKSDKNGIISSKRLKHQSGEYKSVAACDKRVYTMAIVGADIVIDEYNLNCGYMKEMLRCNMHELGITYSYLEKSYQEDNNQNPRIVVDVVLVTGNDIIVYPISGDVPEQTIHYDINFDTDIVWAQRGLGGLFFNDVKGDYFLMYEGKIHPMDLGENCVPFNPMLSLHMFYSIDLNTVSLMEFWMYAFDTNNIEIIPLSDEETIGADYEICNDTVFSELRDIRLSINSRGDSQLCGVKKEGGKFGCVHMFDLFKVGCVEFPEPGFEIYKCILVGIVSAAAMFAAAFLIIMLIRRVLSVRKVIVKQVLLSIVVIAVSCVFIYFFMLGQMRNIVYSQIITLLTSTLDYIELSIDSDDFRDNGLTEEQRNICRDYEKRPPVSITYNSGLISTFIETDFNVSYIEIARDTDSGYKYEFYSNQPAGADVSYFITDEEQMKLYTGLPPDKDFIDSQIEYNSEWLGAVCAITDSNGKQVGFIQIGSKIGLLNYKIHRFAGMMALFVMILIAVISLLFIMIMGGLLRPLKKLKRAVSEVADGKIGTTVAINSNDELQDIAASFSDMSRRLERYFRSITTISKAYEKYLPKGFFRLMDKDSVLDVNPGDHSYAKLTYLFVGIDWQSASFTEESGFVTLNSIYSVVSDVLGKTNGTIQSFSYRMITCIFSSGAAEAAEAALTIEEKLDSHADIKARITVSIQSSHSIIGVIGSGEAMKTITVSPAIELQSYLSVIISKFNLTYVVTEKVLSELNAAGLNISVRKLGTVNFLLGYETRYNETLSEILDGCPDEEKKLRQATLRSYNLALEAAAKGDVVSQRAQLISVLRINRNDLVARFMLEKISGESEGNGYELGTTGGNGLEIST